ncbi:MAG: metallophosphoesterase [Gammaproteobacteria bacterium]|nr:metallophosphoesterase [Gammaproteobacteria bacterium]
MKTKYFYLRNFIFCFGLLLFLFQPRIIAASPKNAERNFLLIPDIHLNSATHHRMDINPHGPNDENDIDLATFQTLLQKIKDGIDHRIIATPEFIIFLGDMPRHRRHGVDEIISDEKAVFKNLKSFSTQFTPEIPVFFVFGNHDSLNDVWGQFYSDEAFSGFHSPYEIATKQDCENGGDCRWADGFLTTGEKCSASGSFTKPCIINENTRYGYYAAYLQNKLKMIALNTVLFTPERKGTTEQDAADELNWLNTELLSAASKQESVLLATHVPFGYGLEGQSEFWVASDQERFLKILKQYKNNIIGILAGHTHKEEAKIVREAATNSDIAVLMIAAELATVSGNAPSFRTIYFSGNEQSRTLNWALSDYETYNFIAEDAFGVYLAEPTLEKLYRFSDYYTCKNNEDILDCAKNITATKMEKYYTAGNSNYKEKIKIPENIYVTIPGDTPYNPGNNSVASSKLSGGAIAAIAAGVAAAGIGAVIVYDDFKTANETK